MIRYLIRIGIEIKILQKSSSKFTKQEVVGLVDSPQTPVRVVVGTGTGTERAHCKLKSYKDISYTLLSLALFITFCLQYYFIHRQLLCLTPEFQSRECPFQHQLLVLCIPNPQGMANLSNVLASCFPCLLWLGNIPDGEILHIIVLYTISVGFYFQLVLFVTPLPFVQG